MIKRVFFFVMLAFSTLLQAKAFTGIHSGFSGLYMSDGFFGNENLNSDLDVLIPGLSAQNGFHVKIYRNVLMRGDTLKKPQQEIKGENGIFFYNTTVPPMKKNIYFYVFASCYCDLYRTGKKGYYVFFSPVKRQKKEYELQRHFNEIIRKTYSFWPKFNQAEIIENGFPTISQARKSKNIAIHNYETKGFKVLELKW